MTTAKKANERAAEKGSGKGGASNAAGTQTGPGSSAESRSKQSDVRDIRGAGSAKTTRNRPGQKTGG